MLVMYTIYDSISKTLPVTAYLKMIDYWLLFCLLVPFTIFMIEIVWLLSHKRLATAKQTGWTIDDITTATRKPIQVIVPIGTLTFVAFYFSLAIVQSYSAPSM